MSAPTLDRAAVLAAAIQQMAARVTDAIGDQSLASVWHGDDTPQYARATRAVERRTAALVRLTHALARAGTRAT